MTTYDYDPEIDHAEAVLGQIAERIAAASLMAAAESDDPVNPILAVAENAFMTGLAVGLLAPAWARVLHEDSERAVAAVGMEGRMSAIVADITRDFPLGE